MRLVGWWIATLVLTSSLVAMWHTILLKVDLRATALLVPLAICWVAVGAARRLERGAAPANGPPRVWSRCGGQFWWLLALFSLLLVVFNSGFMRAASDGRGYFAQVRSIVIGLNFDFTDDIAAFAAREQDAALPIGTALLWSPFFLLAHAWLGLLNLLGSDHVRDGFTNPYQRAVGLGTLCYGFAAIAMIATALRRHFAAGVAFLATTTILLATPAVWYLTVDASMSHGVSLFAVTAFLSLWLAGRNRVAAPRWGLLAATAFLMILVRPQNALFLMVPAADYLARGRSSRAALLRAATSRRVVTAMIAVAVAAIGALALGLGNSLTEYVAAQRLLEEFSPLQVLFSPRHGLVSSSPVLLLALFGIALLYRIDRGLSLALGLVVAAQVLLSAAAPGWSAGASFGARRFVACALPFAFGLAATIEGVRRKPLVATAVVLSAFMVTNLTLVNAVGRGEFNLSDPLPFERMMHTVSARLGNPFALPGALLFARRHDVPLSMLDRVPANRMRNLILEGTNDDSRFLTEGWFAPEVGAGRTFRWASGPEAGLLVRLQEGSFVLRFVAAPFRVPDGLQTVRVEVAGHDLGTFELTPGFSQHEVELPAAILPDRDWTRVRFHFAYWRSPAELGISADPRQLAVQFDRIQFERR
jgi:hypothetical protein